MNEIEKMYENAGVMKQYDYTVIRKNYDGKIVYTKRAVLEKVEQFKNKTLRIVEVYFYYPEFTAEKQLKLIKWLIIEGYIEDMLTVQISEENFEACLADTFNNLWQSLTEEEKQQVKEILE